MNPSIRLFCKLTPLLMSWSMVIQAEPYESRQERRELGQKFMAPAQSRQFEVLHHPDLWPGPVDPRYVRSLDEYYQRRVYPGSPPFIPHEVIEAKFDGNTSCLDCHGKGGYVPRFQAYAPVTPHPEQVNCRQCHVPQETERFFRPNQWITVKKPKLKQPMLPGGPPPIPHRLQDRGYCLSCHAGPSAIREIRTSHPERVHCRQCHMAISEEVVDYE
jgi:cytochrome c-type protein NapB